MSEVNRGDALYVPANDLGLAMSLGATMVEGDARLRVPSPLPNGVQLSDFSRWSGVQARTIWISEYLEQIIGAEVSLVDASLLGFEANATAAGDYIRLYVPRDEMDRARMMPGVRWSKIDGMYIADRSADMSLIFRYLTEESKARWLIGRNSIAEINALLKARALVAEVEVEDEDVPVLERAMEQYLSIRGKDVE